MGLNRQLIKLYHSLSVIDKKEKFFQDILKLLPYEMCFQSVSKFLILFKSGIDQTRGIIEYKDNLQPPAEAVNATDKRIFSFPEVSALSCLTP